jgi:membrane protease YdiL (CAAX protease family)
MISIIKDFFLFYKSKSSNNEILKNIFMWLISGYILLFSFKSLFGIIKIILLKNNLITNTAGSGTPDQWIAEVSINIFALQAVVFAPLYEEFAFRGILQKTKIIFKSFIVIFISLLICIITGTKIYEFSLNYSIIFISVFAITFLFIKEPLLSLIQGFTQKNTKLIICVMSVLFALWHFGNFDFSKANTFTIIFTFLPFFVSGLIFSWISIRKGFFIGLILHVINNALPVLVAYINHK